MNITADEINDIYKMSYDISSSRGKKRQVVMNNVIINCLKKDNKYSNNLFKQEDNLKSLWGKSKSFKVDVSVYFEKELKEIYLLKGPASNILQNHVNFLNSINSDLDRLSLYRDTTLFKIVNFLPNTSPFFDRKENIKHFEINHAEFLTQSGKIFMMDISETYITFDINDLENCKTKKDVNDLFISQVPIKNIKITTNNYKKPEIVGN